MVKWYHSGLLIRQFGVRIPVALPYKNIFDAHSPQLERVLSAVPWQVRKVLCASIELIIENVSIWYKTAHILLQ